MFKTAGLARTGGILFGLALLLLTSSPGVAQVTSMEFLTGRAAEAWEKWEAAMQAILAREPEQAEAAFGELLELNPSPLRIALLADRTVNTPIGGAVLLFEQDREAEALSDNGRQIAELLATGREQKNQADDGWYFCQIGRFDVAAANFEALIASDPDPVALLEFADRVPKREAILIRVLDNPIVGDAARRILDLLAEGEEIVKADPTRVKKNIRRLGGPPRGFENASQALKQSGEYAVPFLVQFMRDPDQDHLLQPILRFLPKLDRPGLNPMVMALRMEDQATKVYLVEALGDIGYAQAVPYLLRLLQDNPSDQVRTATQSALAQIRAQSGGALATSSAAAEGFYRLAERYYENTPSLAADPRLETANVWYWRDGILQNVPVPTQIFDEVMCMRCCEEALLLQPNHKPSLALWLAANFRRTAQLGFGEDDPTKPDGYPSASYFAKSAGAEYCLMALARAVDAGDPAVALGAIDALRQTAGPASLTTDAEGRLPLAEALTFPDRMVRIRAALTLGAANPQQTFQGYQNLMPVLAEALVLHAGAKNALVVDPDSEGANKVAGVLRAQGFEVLTDASLYNGLQKVRDTLSGIDVIFIASDIEQPGLIEGINALRDEYRFAFTPVVLVSKPGDANLVNDLARADHRIESVPVEPGPTDIGRAVAMVMKAVGAEAITPELGAALAQDAAEVLLELALTNNPVCDIAAAEDALLEALTSENAELRVTVARVLGFLGSQKAQEAIARIALDDTEPEQMRVDMFAALAAAAKRRGNLLPPALVDQIVNLVETAEAPPIREAASQALGSLSVSGEPASEIIRNQYRG